MTDALLFLHVLAAFLLVGAVVMLSSVALGACRPPRTISIANLFWDAGGIGTLVFGVWLALDIDGYGLFDFWIIAAIVLWAIATELGRRARGAPRDGNTGQFAQWHWLAALVVLVLLVDMIFKPGPDRARPRPYLRVGDPALPARRSARWSSWARSCSPRPRSSAPGAPTTPAALRLGYRALLLGALPAWLVMRVAAQWVVDESLQGRRGRRGVDRHRLRRPPSSACCCSSPRRSSPASPRAARPAAGA